MLIVDLLPAIGLAAILAAAPLAAQAQEYRFSADDTVDLGGTMLADDELGVDDGSGAVSALDLGAIPTEADVTAYHADDNGDALFALSVAVELGGERFRAGELIRYDGAAYISEFDPLANGVPRGVEIDAVSVLGGDLLLSFDTAVDLAGMFAADEDLVRFDNPGFSNQFDLSDFGAANALDIDAVHYEASEITLRVSFDGAGEIAGVTFRDQDVLKLDASTSAWSLDYDASAADPGWGNAGLDAYWLAPLVMPGMLQWSEDETVALEAVGTIVLTIERTEGTDGAVEVDWETVADSAIPPDDFVSDSGTASFSDGQTQAQVAVDIVDDVQVEGPERFFVDLVAISAGDAVLGSPTRIEVRIRDDEDYLFADGFES